MSAALAGSMAVAGAPAYGQQASGVGNSGTAGASTGGNSSAGNTSSNVAGNTASQTSPPTTSVPVLGSVLGLVLNLTAGGANASDGTSNVATGPAAAAGNTSDTSASQTKASAPGGGGSPIILGSIFNPFVAPLPDQSSGVTNSGAASASTGGNSGVGNNSTNVASNNQTVNGGLIAIGLQLGNTASNTSNGTSTITTGAANASGNQSTTALDQTRIDGRGGSGGPFGALGTFGIGSGVACDGFFRFGGQRADVGNTGTARADTGGNASVGNQSTNVATNDSTATGGLIDLSVPGLLSNTAANASNGTSNIATGAANASGNRSTTSVDQACIQPLQLASPPPILPGTPILVGARPGGFPNVLPGVQVRPQQLARTGRDPFIMGLVAFSLLFGGLMFLVWERVESYPKRTA